MSSPKHRENNDLTTRHNKRKYNLMSSPKHRENNDFTTDTTNVNITQCHLLNTEKTTT